MSMLACVIACRCPLWFSASPKEAVERTYLTTLYSDAALAADYVRAHSDKDARLAVLGSEPEIYFHSRRRAAAGSIYAYPLMETHPFALQLQKRMIAEITRARPEYVVYVNNQHSWLRKAGSERRIFHWWNAYWTNFEAVATFATTQGPQAFGRDQVAGVTRAGETGESETDDMKQLTRNNFILVLKRKAGL